MTELALQAVGIATWRSVRAATMSVHASRASRRFDHSEGSTVIRSVISRIIECAILAVVGVVALIVPTLFVPDPGYPAPLFPILRSAVEDMSAARLVWLGVVGGVAGLVFRALPPLVVGMSMLSLIPVSVMAEIMVDGGSHNLWPLEFVMYAMIALAPAVGAAAGRMAAALMGVPGRKWK
jgi:hypothetical protein